MVWSDYSPLMQNVIQRVCHQVVTPVLCCSRICSVDTQLCIVLSLKLHAKIGTIDVQPKIIMARLFEFVLSDLLVDNSSAA